MPRRTFREVDGERVEGVSRPVFIRNAGRYFLTDLVIYADGAIDAWGLTDLDGLRRHLETGWVATSLKPGQWASAHQLASWKLAEPSMSVTADDLLGQVADAIEQLNGRPDSSRRCWLAIEKYMDTRSEEDRRALRQAYQAIPEIDRIYVLGDMDRKDVPLRVLITELGEPLPVQWQPYDPEVVTEDDRAEAIRYFEEVLSYRKTPRPAPPDDPEPVEAGAITLYQTVFPHGWPEDPGILVLRNEYPADIEVGSVSYPTVTHAYWALSTTDQAAREQIMMAERPYDAETLAKETGRVEGWATVRAAVMLRLLRAKFTQYPALAEILVGTGTARIHYTGTGSDYWHEAGERGRNWMGRLLELVRAELHAERLGLATDG
ncbi:NADAR family protein [Nonomuraea harbinensis]|uniref:NADAR family protein n=1 Tax=Nonomuraea harbinensis TaxID=1286938 RepID=A0ABW1C884_9ACTN|nr:NADAR family protein [Nonomuraea harbinensis]